MAKDSVSQEEQKQLEQERLKYWKKWITDFKKSMATDGVILKPIPNAAILLNDYYWRLVTDYLRPLLDESEKEFLGRPKLHFYKIISASELVVMAVLPFEVEKPTGWDRKEINARFAWYIAMEILLSWKIGEDNIIDFATLKKIITFCEIIDVNKRAKKEFPYPRNFRDEHIDWLKALNISGALPILSNSQIWRMLFLACHFAQN